MEKEKGRKMRSECKARKNEKGKERKRVEKGEGKGR